VGSPEELYERPRTRFVADFLAVKNLLEAAVVEVAGGFAALRTKGGLVLRARDDGAFRPGGSVLLGIRPERIAIADGGDMAALPGIIDDEIYLGDTTDWRIRLGEETVTVSEGAATAQLRKRGDAVRLIFPPEAMLRLEEQPGS